MVQLKLLHDNCVQVILESQDRFLEFGRQREDEPAAFTVQDIPKGKRLLIADRSNKTIGRVHLELSRIGDSETLQLKNIHTAISVSVGNIQLAAQSATELRLPAEIRVGNIQVEIKQGESFDEYMTLNRPPMASSMRGKAFAEIGGASALHSLRSTLMRGDHESLLYRMEQLVGVLQTSASSEDFMSEVANAAIALIELDHAAVVLWIRGEWKVVAHAPQTSRDAGWKPSQSLLKQMQTTRSTTWSSSQQSRLEISLVDVVAFVAAPILNPHGEVIGAVYGDRQTRVGMQRDAIGRMDAQFVEILACGIAGGLQRLEKEREVLTRRLQFEQFVTPEVASMIEKDSEALKGRDAEVTMLFCDIAGFSAISEKLSPEQTFEWINDVMSALSECVKDHGGTIVDFVGDEIIAMWGAPFSNDAHATAACRAAIAIVKALPAIDDKWLPILNVPTKVGVGLNSGKVRVGNTGSQLKLKYGPLGSTVNIASRIQGATRYLRIPILITGATADLLDEEFSTRRLCKLRVKNIEAPIDIFELPMERPDNWEERRSAYANALSEWEGGRVEQTVNSLSQIVATHKDDIPALVMLARAIEVWSQGHPQYDPVWTLSSK